MNNVLHAISPADYYVPAYLISKKAFTSPEGREGLWDSLLFNRY